MCPIDGERLINWTSQFQHAKTTVEKGRWSFGAQTRMGGGVELLPYESHV